MNLDDDSTQDWLLGGILTTLLGGGVVVAVALSIVLAPLAAYFAFGSGGGGICSTASTRAYLPTTRSSAASSAPSLSPRTSTASLSLRELFMGDTLANTAATIWRPYRRRNRNASNSASGGADLPPTGITGSARRGGGAGNGGAPARQSRCLV